MAACPCLLPLARGQDYCALEALILPRTPMTAMVATITRDSASYNTQPVSTATAAAAVVNASA